MGSVSDPNGRNPTAKPAEKAQDLQAAAELAKLSGEES
jgi:hypothetical protein